MMLLLVDIGNTRTHLGVAGRSGVKAQARFPTSWWAEGRAAGQLRRALIKARVARAKTAWSVAFCSVAPEASRLARSVFAGLGMNVFELSDRTLVGLGIRYPKPRTIGPDRLANALACLHHFGAPSVAVDFGTAVTFDVVDKEGCYVGGIIGPGMAILTDYLHEKTALLPRIELRAVRGSIGRSTEEAMLIGAVHGYRGLVRQLLSELRKELRARRLPVIATGGDAKLLTAGMPEITAVAPDLTLEGLRLAWTNAKGQASPSKRRGAHPRLDI